VLRFAGAAYVVWLGVQSLLRLRRGKPLGEPERRAAPARRSFAQGLLSNVLNAKTATFYLALLPQFAVVRETVLRDSLLLAALHFAMSFVWLGGIALLADRARRALARPWVTRGVDAVAGVALVAFGVRLALARR
jgi:threonine/homoserine/homoserine lactone efflux protein